LRKFKYNFILNCNASSRQKCTQSRAQKIKNFFLVGFPIQNLDETLA